MDSAKIEMEITDVIEKILKEYPFFLEIEMLQGECELLPNGMIKYKIEIFDNNKIQIAREFCLKAISKSHLLNGN